MYKEQTKLLYLNILERKCNDNGVFCTVMEMNAEYLIIDSVSSRSEPCGGPHLQDSLFIKDVRVTKHMFNILFIQKPERASE